MPCGVKPMGTCCRLARLCRSRPAPISRMVAKAISAAASILRRRARISPADPRPPCLRASPRFAPRARQAGASPKRSPVSSVKAQANRRTSESTCTAETGSRLGGSAALMARTAAKAPRMPQAPPAAASTPLSTSSWRTSRPRPAPRAARTASSVRRATERASRRLAMLAQAIRSTKTTAPSSIHRAVRSWVPTKVSVKVTSRIPQSRTSGYCRPTAAAIRSISDCAWVSVTPPLRRPTTRIR